MITELDQFTTLLYDHKFDVDDIIFALCGDTHEGRWLLNTRQGELISESATTKTSHISDGDDNNHWHVITPLPLSFIDDARKTQAYKRLEDGEKQKIEHILVQVKQMADLPLHFSEGHAGGWLRERVKDAALEWLDCKNLIPPSMRHVYHRHAAASKKEAPSKIKFE